MPEQDDTLRYQALALERFGEPEAFRGIFVSGSIAALHELRREITTAQQVAAKTWKLNFALEKLSWSSYLLNTYFVPLHEEQRLAELSNGRNVSAVETARVAARQAVAVARTTGKDTFDQEVFWRNQALNLCSERSSLYPVVTLEKMVMEVRQGDELNPNLLTQQFQEVIWRSPESADKLALYAWWVTEAGLRLKSRGLVEYGWGLVKHFSERAQQSANQTYLLEEGIYNLVFPYIRRIGYQGDPTDLLPRIPLATNLSEKAANDILRSGTVDRTVLA